MVSVRIPTPRSRRRAWLTAWAVTGSTWPRDGSGGLADAPCASAYRSQTSNQLMEPVSSVPSTRYDDHRWAVPSASTTGGISATSATHGIAAARDRAPASLRSIRPLPQQPCTRRYRSESELPIFGRCTASGGSAHRVLCCQPATRLRPEDGSPCEEPGRDDA